MRLSHPLFSSVGFQFSSAVDLLKALDGACGAEELDAVTRLYELRLPPVTSSITLATILGINPGLIWSFQYRTSRYYREFHIKKGRGLRAIQAPRVALKLIQKWLSIVWADALSFPDHVYGFIQGRSHIDAALIHVDANWVFSVDIRDFFRSTPKALVASRFVELGYPDSGASLLANLTCLNGFLAQGAPSSPILSNLCFSEMDLRLREIADRHQLRLTRYADDVVFSGTAEIPETFRFEVESLFIAGPWKLAPEKMEMAMHPNRLKVHGLLVDGQLPRLTKGYRNKLRAFHHILKKADLPASDRVRLAGHISYSNFVEHVIRSRLRGQDVDFDDLL